jgi:hypothetical protein
VVEGAQNTADDNTGHHGKTTRNHASNGAENYTRSDMAVAQFVGLDLALVIFDQDTDRAELDVLAGLIPLLNLIYCFVSGSLVFKKCEYQLFLFCHFKISLKNSCFPNM